MKNLLFLLLLACVPERAQVPDAGPFYRCYPWVGIQNYDTDFCGTYLEAGTPDDGLRCAKCRDAGDCVDPYENVFCIKQSCESEFCQ